jgi:ribosomal protein S18 acetylase RimI-like enzyme
MRLFQVLSESDIQHAHKLFEEYAAGLGFSLCFQNFDQELASLPGDYAAPGGRLLLAESEGEVAGCVALRKLDDSTCEMKRLFVRPEFRGKRLGKSLIQTIISEARTIGYQRMRLDTIPGKMDDAIALYRNIGFKEVGPYYNNPTPGTLYMELDLARVGLEHV